MSVQVFQKAAPSCNYIKSLTGMAKNFNRPFASDIQSAYARMQRVGVGYLCSNVALGTGSSGYTPAGPLTNTRLPSDTSCVPDLYMDCDIEITWTSGATAKRSIRYDFAIQDMTVTDTFSWTSSSVQTNVAPAYFQYIFFNTSGASVAPPSAPPGFSYLINTGVQSYSESLNGAKEVATMTYAQASSGGTTYYGATLTITVANKKKWGQWSAQLEAMLATVDLNNPTPTYNQPTDLFPNQAGNYSLCWLKDLPAVAAARRQTNILEVSNSRSGYQYWALNRIFTVVYPGAGITTTSDNVLNYIKMPWNGNLYTGNSGGVRRFVRNPVFATCVPSPDSQTFFKVNFYRTPIALTSLAPYVISAKSIIRNNGDMNYRLVKSSYSETSHSFTTVASTSNLLPQYPSQTTSDQLKAALSLSGYGICFCNHEYGNATAPYYGDATNGYDNVAATRVVSFGGSETFTAFFEDHYSNRLDYAGCTWSLTNITGTIVQSDLTVAADGITAVFNANHRGTCKVRVSYPGRTVITPDWSISVP